MRKIAVFTGTRAEYGLLFWIMKGLQQENNIDFQLFVGGMHLSKKFGFTVKQIEADGFNITERLDFLMPSDSPKSIANSMAIALTQASEAFYRYRPDLLVILGDRSEAMAIAQAAMILRIPIAHIHGGETTEGAIDEASRHSISKMAHLHFTATEPYRKRVIQLGEHPDRVFNFGAPGIDSINQFKLLDLEELSFELGFEFNKPYFVVTFHPVTLMSDGDIGALINLISVLNNYPTYKILVSYPNADAEHDEFIRILDNFSQNNKGRVHLFRSLGQLKYLSALKHCEAVLGNSSSGLIEAPSFGVPSLNIGDRQKGRLAGTTVVTCSSSRISISEGLNKILSSEFMEVCSKSENPYGKGNSSSKIVSKLISYPLKGLIKKQFYDLDNEK
ncbi:UDP-N-acetylglucosamine 2-epimerase [Gammaproteobacteria bacterium]|nr:UDP-N-acetylglucosamine 2-epimerase [Gammaproteobacteria bacterium]MDC0090014.1 UDP-N-acetylglucosamine 2-epimerase [Gammaproteobacteria bacterium]